VAYGTKGFQDDKEFAHRCACYRFVRHFVSGASAHERCGDGVNLKFAEEFAELKSSLGDTVGEPLDCHEQAATGDIIQHTTTGKAFIRPSVGIPTFTDGWRHWELTDD